MSDHNGFGAFMVGLVIGALTGGVVALLFAPQSGEKTRILIKDRSIELRDKAQEAVKSVRDQSTGKSASDPDAPPETV